ncbi:MAG TPA: amidophosphoribosyltransferase [Longimicrobiales bacterium]|nr:amidophosphoribosyltransferase [Longimicrobiales bacterium]
MCGIVGIAGIARASELAYLGLYALQHRGQEAAGICAVDDAGRAQLQKAHGLVMDGFGDDVLAQLPGRVALGHVRYSTAGGPGLVNAQPILVRYHQGDLALVHNGNITNALELRARLVQDGALFQTTVDSEVIVHLVARSRAATVDEQVIEALTQLTGAASVILTVGDVMYAARDPWGYRPLILGALQGGHVIASETCALDLVGATLVRELGPGEVIRIRRGAVEELPRLGGATRAAPCIFELVYFARPDSRIWGASVDRARRAFGRQLAREQPAEADCVFSVPDSSNSAALGYAEQSGIAYELGLIRNHYVGRTFIHPTQKGRDFRVRIKYNAVREVLQGKRVVVVDDSLVRGTTSRGLIALIREAGAREVHFRVSSPPVTNPCYYGIDMPTRDELIGAQKTVEEIRQHLNVDSLGYLSLEGMHSAVADHGPFCDACFSGNYLAPLVDLQMGHGLTSHC